MKITGFLMFLLLLSGLGFWLLVDVVLWFCGLSTMSQWVIATAEAYEWFGWLMLFTIIGVAVGLIGHFRLLKILLKEKGD